MSNYRKPNVYIVNDSGHDFSPARSRGEFVILTKGKVNVFSTDRLLSDIKKKMEGSNEDDFLLTAGNGIVACLAYAAFMLKHGRVNLLIFSFKRREYEVRTMTLLQYNQGGT